MSWVVRGVFFGGSVFFTGGIAAAAFKFLFIPIFVYVIMHGAYEEATGAKEMKEQMAAFAEAQKALVHIGDIIPDPPVNDEFYSHVGRLTVTNNSDADVERIWITCRFKSYITSRIDGSKRYYDGYSEIRGDYVVRAKQTTTIRVDDLHVDGLVVPGSTTCQSLFHVWVDPKTWAPGTVYQRG